MSAKPKWDPNKTEEMYEYFYYNVPLIEVNSLDLLEETAECTRISKGSPDYYDTSLGGWLPGSGPEYEVGGYNKYVSLLVDACVESFASFYEIDESMVPEYVREELKSDYTELLDDYLTDDAYRDKAIEAWENGDHQYYREFEA